MLKVQHDQKKIVYVFFAHRIRANTAPLLIRMPSWIEQHPFAKEMQTLAWKFLILWQTRVKFEYNATLRLLKSIECRRSIGAATELPTFELCTFLSHTL